LTFTRRDFLTVAAAAVAGSTQPTAPRARRNPPALESRQITLPHLLPEHDGLRVAQLSDLHVGPRTPRERIRAAIELVNQHCPDLVVLTGDYLSNQRRGVGLMREQLGGLEAPTYAVLGNHDHWVDARGARAALEGLGYAVLRNQHSTLQLRGAPFTVVGIGDLLTGNARPADALHGAPAASSLVLAHGPKTANLLRRADRPMLCLSGHTHGGQINVPGLTPALLRTLAGEPYAQGLFHVGRVLLYVNRGVGNSAFRLRVNAPPEVSLFTLRSGRTGT
jgi:hypothetical protein